jgi:hypothetical protein
MVFKIPKDEVCFSISFLSFFQFFQFLFLKKNPTNNIYSCPCNFFEFGLHVSDFHINVYHVFDVNFEYL